MGDLTHRFGEVAEHLVLPNIIEKFNTLGYDFVGTGRERKFKDRQTGRFGVEVDILLENGSYSIAVEVKVKPDKRDVEDHIKRLEFLRRYKDDVGDKREIRGALAGGDIGGRGAGGGVERGAVRAGAVW
jgi:predicted AAA+ superfamily ATPase